MSHRWCRRHGRWHVPYDLSERPHTRALIRRRTSTEIETAQRDSSCGPVYQALLEQVMKVESKVMQLRIGAVYARTETIRLRGRNRGMRCAILKGITSGLATAVRNGEYVRLNGTGNSH